jgi:hypothetical protein
MKIKYEKVLMLLIHKDLKKVLIFFAFYRLLFSLLETPLWQRGARGDFINKKTASFFLKIPLHPPFPKGDLLQPLEHSSL